MNGFMQVEVMDPEQAAAKLEQQQAALLVKERDRLAAANRAAGRAEPKPGDKLYVTSSRGIKRRSRAGVVFTDEDKREVRVVAPDKDPEITDEYAEVHPHGAEMILADNALNVNAPSATETEAALLRQQNAELEARNADLTSEIKRLRDARAHAPDPGDGTPARLKAAEAARKDTVQGHPGRKGGGSGFEP